MDKKLESKKSDLVRNIPKWTAPPLKYRGGPSLYFYQKVILLRQKKSPDELMEKDDFIELLYATLGCWDMNTRGAKMKDFSDFKGNILKNRKPFQELSKYSLDKIDEKEIEEIKKALGNLYDNLNFMESRARLVANSKVMHFILPNLVMPMDRGTLEFFFGNNSESKNKFLKIFQCTYQIVKKVDLHQYLYPHFDNVWNLTITKVIDNAIIGSIKGRKER